MIELPVKYYNGNPGTYYCQCSECLSRFVGDKRDSICPSCEAYSVSSCCGSGLRVSGAETRDDRIGATFHYHCTKCAKTCDPSKPKSEEELSQAMMSAMLVRWKDRILAKAATNIEGHFIDGPAEDFSEEQKGYERGLRISVDEVCKLMVDPSYFGRKALDAKEWKL